MKSFHYFLILTISLQLASCRALVIPEGKKVQYINTGTITKFNGIYKNIQPKYSKSNSPNYNHILPLWNQFSFLKNYFRKDKIKNHENYVVELQVLNETAIRARLFWGDKLMGEKIIKGRIKNNYFLTKRKIKVEGIPFLLFGYADTQFNMGIDEKGNLVINRVLGKFGMLLILAHGYTEEWSFYYHRE